MNTFARHCTLLEKSITLATKRCNCHKCGLELAGRMSNGGFYMHVSAGRKQFARHEWAQKAAYLLGCTLEELSSSIFKHQAKGTLPRAGTIRQTSEENGTADAGTQQNTCFSVLFSLHPCYSVSLCHSLSAFSHTRTLTRICVCSSPRGNCMHGRKKSTAYLSNEYYTFALAIDRWVRTLCWDKQFWIPFSFFVLEIIIASHWFLSRAGALTCHQQTLKGTGIQLKVQHSRDWQKWPRSHLPCPSTPT